MSVNDSTEYQLKATQLSMIVKDVINLFVIAYQWRSPTFAVGLFVRVNQ